MTLLLTLLGMGLLTWLIRLSFFALGERVTFPAWLIEALRYVPVAVLTAIIAPAVFMPEGPQGAVTLNPYLAGALATGWISWRYQHLLASIACGMLVFAVVRFLFPLF